MQFFNKNRRTCRICESADLEEILYFPNYPFADNCLASPENPKEFLLDYRAHLCRSCGITQNLTDLNWGDYYDEYQYTVSHSALIEHFMEAVASRLYDTYKLPHNARVVEVGSGDGGQLKRFALRGAEVLGYEPSVPLAHEANRAGIKTKTELFTNDSVSELGKDDRPIDLFMLFNTLDHLPDPLGCLRLAKKLLNPETGLVLVEVHDLEKIIERNEACLFIHEHTTYLSTYTIAKLFDMAGLKLLSVSLVPEEERRGNSLLALGALKESVWEPEPELAHTHEDDTAGERERILLRNFRDSVTAAHQRLREYVLKGKKQGRSFAAYGASARAISTLAIADLNASHFDYVLDQNPVLRGKFLPRSHVPIQPPEYVFTHPVQEVIVFSYGYMQEIAACLKPFTDRGGKLISFISLL